MKIISIWRKVFNSKNKEQKNKKKVLLLIFRLKKNPLKENAQIS